MNNNILRTHKTHVEPMLTAAGIPWGKHGLCVGVVEYGDFESCRMVAQEAIHALAALTQKLERANAVIVALRGENGALRGRNAP